MTKRVIAALLCFLMLLPFTGVKAAEPITEAEAYHRLAGLRGTYPEGRGWSNKNYYSGKSWQSGARGCMGFAMMASDHVFGNLPPRTVYKSSVGKIRIDMLRVGDILRLPGHSVVVLEKHGDYINTVEGNWQRRVHWGRKITASQVARASYYTTRYPVSTAPAQVIAPAKPQIVAPPKTTVSANGKTLSFSDIENHWAKKNIIACVESGLMSGVGAEPNLRFLPDDIATREELAAILYRAKGSPEIKTKIAFKDVSEDWAKDACAWAVNAGIMSETEKGYFSPRDSVSREMLAAVLYRFADGKTENTYNLKVFSDNADVSPWAEDALSWTVKHNILTGKNGKLDPQGKTTRAELATVLIRFSEHLMKVS